MQQWASFMWWGVRHVNMLFWALELSLGYAWLLRQNPVGIGAYNWSEFIVLRANFPHQKPGKLTWAWLWSCWLEQTETYQVDPIIPIGHYHSGNMGSPVVCVNIIISSVGHAAMECVLLLSGALRQTVLWADRQYVTYHLRLSWLVSNNEWL